MDQTFYLVTSNYILKVRLDCTNYYSKKNPVGYRNTDLEQYISRRNDATKGLSTSKSEKFTRIIKPQIATLFNSNNGDKLTFVRDKVTNENLYLETVLLSPLVKNG